MPIAYVSKFPGNRRLSGFTLIELMITVAIIGMLVKIAYPAYVNSVLKSRRTDAKTSLLDFAAREERYFSTNNIYTNTASNLGYSGSFPVNVLSGSTAYYQLSVSLTGTPTGTTYTATATAINGQTADACGNYTLTSGGVQGNSTTAANCW
jgi:type IV pilus assembly protein PilE